jgi:hypothetical protein
MNYLIGGAIIFILVILGLILFIFMPKPLVYFDVDPSFNILNDNFAELKKEVDQNNNNQPIIPIYGNGKIYTDVFPQLYETLRSIPDVQFAGLINIKPLFEQKSQYGYDRLSDYSIRTFFVINHSATKKSGIWIDGQKRFFESGELICGDMSREHKLFNRNKKKYTTVLFVDTKRPDNIHRGVSPNSQIIEDEILNQFNQIM